MKSRLFIISGYLLTVIGFLACCSQSDRKTDPAVLSDIPKSSSVAVTQNTKQAETESSIVIAARNQVGKTVDYDPAYVKLEYPGGDGPIEKGVCTDVVIRALRDALDMDLQKLVHKDMKAAFSEYPNRWGLEKPDPNIDHRRVPNLKKYFERKGYSVGVTQMKEDYLPGDLVTCTLDRNLPHIMIVSDKQGQDGIPWIIHNIGGGAQEENRLFDFPLTGHYRIRESKKKMNFE